MDDQKREPGEAKEDWASRFNRIQEQHALALPPSRKRKGVQLFRTWEEFNQVKAEEEAERARASGGTDAKPAG